MNHIGRAKAWLADEWDGVRDHWSGFSSEKKTLVGAFLTLVVLVVVAVGGFVVTRTVTGGGGMNTDTYKDALVKPNGGDLPAPDFVGWTATPREEAPTVSENDPTISSASPEKCAPGGTMHQDVQRVLLGEADNWSGETLNLVAYNARFDIDLADPGSRDMSPIDRWAKDCARSRFTKDGIEHVQRIQTLPLEPNQWEMDDSRVYVVTLTRIKDDTNLGTTSTLYALSRYKDVTAQGALTIRGSVNDNALSTLNKAWDKQTIKLRDFVDADIK